jgi:hypothetical protein
LRQKGLSVIFVLLQSNITAMKAWAITLIVIIIAAIAGAFYLATRSGASSSPTPTASTTPDTDTTPVSSSTPATSDTGTPAAGLSDLIRVDAPKANEVVKSPLTVVGSARGTWYFEASFPIRVEDANGKVLGQTPAQAQGDWMTTSFVPFAATLTTASSTTATGYLVLEKDNPSGLPENAAELRIPIRFR